jgi:short-subunit dehydrogenase
VEQPIALVTGASSGIGEAFALALAERGNHLVVVARNEERLRTLAESLGSEQAVEVEVLPADLETSEGVATVEARLGDPDRPIELLVNNAGFGTHGAFHELPVDRELGEVRLNVLALVQLTHAALGPMVERGHGGVINVSSIGAYQPMPSGAVYGASKAFVSSFTNAIHEELRGTGVKAMAVAPGFTRTEFHLRGGMQDAADASPGFLWKTPDVVVAAALAAFDRGRAVCIPGGLNVATAAVSGSLPAGISRRLAGKFVAGR